MADESIFNGGDGPPPEGGRRRLQLKPRSAEGVAAANAQRSTKSNSFGAYLKSYQEKKPSKRDRESNDARAEGRDGDGGGGGDAEAYGSFGGRSGGGGGGGYGGGRESNDAKLYVGNLNFDTTEVRLLVLFSFAFVCAGKLMKLLHFCCSTEYCP